ncbi:MAG: UDP-N-acetylmuramoyl-tripeptide--D-alanyl-D-alanine ligase [Crocinitomicaceae bacterium]|nr:UDP-N-acetylmuramoyl-tripeptide--D-alanyl-D-alanine ligase [Crocinitomicaceae bacterium]|tara:strand:+ start:62 stop:1372 length:1311 start_codon:yes stop_codon:yes gene_type:complete
MNLKKLYKLYQGAENGVTTDSRKCGPGMLFFAIKGENFDGNRFAQEALKKGCIASVVDDVEIGKSEGIVHVDNVLATIQKLATMHRRNFDIPVLGLTGSNGKTTTKELIKLVLSNKYNVHATEGNLNNHLGVPLTLLSMPVDCEFLVVEMGANHMGEIAELANIAEPNFGIITNIGLAHLEGFGSAEGVKKGKTELFDYLRSTNNLDGSHKMAFVHGGHPVLIEVSEGMERIIFGTDQEKPRVVFSGEGMRRQFMWDEDGYKSNPAPILLEGDYNLDNISAAIAVGRFFDIEREAITASISNYVPTNNRSQTITTDSNEILLDAYNANPSSMEQALKSFALHKKNPRLVILGDMRELGTHSMHSHSRIVELCHELALNAIFVGEAFGEVSQVKNTGRFFSSLEELISEIKGGKIKGENILLKGSRGMAMERLLPLL